MHILAIQGWYRTTMTIDAAHFAHNWIAANECKLVLVPRSNPPPPRNTLPQQSGGAGQPGGNPGAPSVPPVLPPSQDAADPWAPLDRSRKSLPKLSIPSDYKNCSILDMQQMLEDWYNIKSTFAIATWRGDAQRYWLVQVLFAHATTNGYKVLRTDEQP